MKVWLYFVLSTPYHCDLSSIHFLIYTSYILSLLDGGWFDQRQHGASESSGSCWEGQVWTLFICAGETWTNSSPLDGSFQQEFTWIACFNWHKVGEIFFFFNHFLVGGKKCFSINRIIVFLMSELKFVKHQIRLCYRSQIMSLIESWMTLNIVICIQDGIFKI